MTMSDQIQGVVKVLLVVLLQLIADRSVHSVDNMDCILIGPDKSNGKSQYGNAWEDAENPVTQRWSGERIDLWSLRPLAATPPPQIPSDIWSTNTVDRFVLEKLQSRRISPSSEATKEVLIRRATFDLTGLPPTFAEVQAFVLDDSIDAYDQLIERLLASHEYGVRWAQHWLDVVRYSDSNGFERDEYIPTRWRFRNYVIECFNQDLPYDQFIREQLAGDELAWRNPNSTRRADFRIATMFLRLGPWDSYKAFFDSAEMARDDLLVDVTNTTASAFLGQTFACCRCHDHKTEPLLQADHFRLRAVFAGMEFDDDVIIDDSPTEHRIAQHNRGIEAKQRDLQSASEAILKPARAKQ